jgi:Outer membrane protein transport protein (OMPP1/FadL/TodX)
MNAMKRYSVLLAIVLLLPGLVMAQNFTDAYRMSFNQIQGTARSAGMGNAFGALGGDFTSLSINPAGSAIYQSGEFVITPGYYINKSDMKMNGKTFSDNDQRFSLNNAGAVGSFKTNRSEAGIISVNYGIGVNRMANFNSSAYANNSQSAASYLDDITAYANSEALSNAYLGQAIGNIYYSDWPAKLAWENYLINPVEDNNGNAIDGVYQSILLDGEKVDQFKSFAEDGRIDEYVFNLSANFNHKFYLGATLGFNDLRYARYLTYDEVFGEGGDMRYTDDYHMSGSGVNFKIGAIYKPVQNIRLGFAFHSPTFYQINEESRLGMQSSEQIGSVDPGVNYYNYDFNTPLKLVMSGALVFNKKGLISVDAEYMDYGSMRFRRGGNGSDNFNDLNSVMNNNFNSVLNLRVGAEYKLTNNFAIRGGYEMYGNPFKGTLDDQSTLTDNTDVISGGFGYSINAFSVNVAYTHALYNISDGNVQPNYYQVERTNTNQNILLTLGFRF